jgi:gamma-glutamylcyclotransferase (GGCT)/AIG2-like uncharacterized protein YtfP
MTERVFYFAYGSNMDLERLEKRIGKVTDFGPAILRDNKLVFNVYSESNDCAAANIEHKKGEKVVGRLVKITTKQLEKLDNVEGVPKGRYRRASLDDVIMAQTSGGIREVGKFEGGTVYTYIATDEAVKDSKEKIREKPPTSSYLAPISKGLRQIAPGGELTDRILDIPGKVANGKSASKKEVGVSEVYGSPKGDIISTVRLSNALRKELDVNPNDVVEVEHEGKKMRMRVQLAPGELVSGDNSTSSSYYMTISKPAREQLGIGKSGKRQGKTQFSQLYEGVKIRKVE